MTSWRFLLRSITNTQHLRSHSTHSDIYWANWIGILRSQFGTNERAPSNLLIVSQIPIEGPQTSPLNPNMSIRFWHQKLVILDWLILSTTYGSWKTLKKTAPQAGGRLERVCAPSLYQTDRLNRGPLSFSHSLWDQSQLLFQSICVDSEMRFPSLSSSSLLSS